MPVRSVAAAVALLAFACASGSPAQEHAPLSGYTVDPAWPKKPADVKWGEIPGVAVDQQDRVWLFTRQQPVVQVYAADGTLVKIWNDVEHKRAHHIKVDAEGNVWLTDIELHTVRKYSPEGKLLLSLGTPGETGEDERHFNKPTDMAFAANGDIFVSDGYGNNRVAHFDKGGKFVKAWGKKGPGPGQFDLPHGIGIDSKGRVYVADRNNARIQVFDQDGKFLEEWRNILVPWNISVTTQDEVWSCGSSPTLAQDSRGMTGIPPHDQIFVKFSASGKILRLWMPPKGQDGQEKPGETNWVHALAVDSKGNLYCGDIKGQRAQKFVLIK